MTTKRGVTFAAVGLDHRHIVGQTEGMLDAGGRCKTWWSERGGDAIPRFVKAFPDVPQAKNLEDVLSDPEIDLIVIAAVPDQRAGLAIRAMEAGKDVMVDKPGCITEAELAEIRACVARTGRIWTIDFSERFEVPAVERAAELIAEGAIGRVVQTAGLGPHRINRDQRPGWFFEPRRFGGILCDIASHQVDQFLYLTGSSTAEIAASAIGNFANLDIPDFQDFGEILLHSDRASGYIRVDWYTPDALPTWGDGRLTILGTEGYIEIRKYVDVAGRGGTDHVFLVNGEKCDYIDASGNALTYFDRLSHDICHRSETAVGQVHTFTVMDLAIKAQRQAKRIGRRGE